MLVAAPNPKIAARSLAFVPQILDPAAGGIPLQVVLPGSIAVALTMLAETGGVGAATRPSASPGEGPSAQRARAAARTSSAWPGTFTFGQIRATVPSRSISTVVRSTPMYLRPYMLFSAQTP